MVCCFIYANNASAGWLNKIVKIVTAPVRLVVGGIGNSGGNGMVHDAHREREKQLERENIARNQDAVKSRQRILELSEQIRRSEDERKDAEAKAAEFERDQESYRTKAAQMEEQIAQTIKEIADIAKAEKVETDKTEGSKSPQDSPLDYLIQKFYLEEDLAVKEYWATAVLISYSSFLEAAEFLLDVRGWAEDDVLKLTKPLEE